jgi:phage-related protein
MPTPTPAVTAGYNTNTYSSSIYSSSTVDEGLTYADGFQWYFGNFFGYTPPNSAGVTFNMDGSMSVASQPNSGILLATAGQTSGTPGYVGSVFTGGAYFEAELLYDPASVSPASGWPKFGVTVIEHLLATSGQEWAGQASTYLHYFEAEIMDAFLAATDRYRGILHDRFGTGGTSTVDDTQTFVFGTSPNFNTSHTYGLLWVPATSSAQGYFKFYFDETQVGSTVFYSQFTTQTPPPTTGTFWTYGVLDNQSAVLTLGSGTGSPVKVVAVNVWQNIGVPFNAVEVPKTSADVVITPGGSQVVNKLDGIAVAEPSFVAVAKADGVAVAGLLTNSGVTKLDGIAVVEPNNVSVAKLGADAVLVPPTTQVEVFKLGAVVVAAPIKPEPVEFTTFLPPDSIQPTGDTTVDFTVRVLEAGFGNDYIITEPDGLNATNGVYSVVFDGLTVAERDDIEAFFDARQGMVPFYYTMAGESTAKVFKCKTWTRTQVGPSWKLTCEFRQTFDLA